MAPVNDIPVTSLKHRINPREETTCNQHCPSPVNFSDTVQNPPPVASQGATAPSISDAAPPELPTGCMW